MKEMKVTLSHIYNAMGQVAETTDAKLKTTTDREAGHVPAAGSRSRQGKYDANGNLAKPRFEMILRWLKRSSAMSSTRRVAVVFTAIAFMLTSAIASFAETINYTYDDMLRLINARYGDGTSVDYVYDNLGNRLTKTTTLPGAPANNPPNTASNPIPTNSGTNISTTPTLTWASGDPDTGDALIYSLYFGTSSTPSLVATGFESSYSPGQLQSLTTYHWKVVARDNHNSITEGPLWSFTTKNDPPIASFAANQTSGWAPLTVLFTDISQSPDDEIVSWAWDFNGDGITDSTERNPSYTYFSGGSYTVSLTVTDAHGAIAIQTMPGYLTIYDGENPSPYANIQCVTNASELQAALTLSQSNGQDNIIRLVQGTYGISGNNSKMFKYEAGGAHRLHILGGYTAGCSSRDLNPTNTILNGENIYQGTYSYGGVLYLDNWNDSGFIEVDGVTIQNGNARWGGGLDIETSQASIRLINTEIKNNNAKYAGGVYLYTGIGAVYFNKNNINNNMASQNYGGTYVFTDSYADIYLTDNIINGNTAMGSIGGICLDAQSGTTIFACNVVTQNSASYDYGGASISGWGPGHTYIINNTISANTITAPGGDAKGIYIYPYSGSSIDMHNNIIWNNPGASGSEIHINNVWEGAGMVNAFNNNFDPTKVYGTFTTQGNNLNVDPLFVSAATGDYRLKPASPVRDMGSNTAPSLPATDILGNPRISGSTVDIGAYEFVDDIDDDDDGMPDTWETSHGLNPFDPSDAGQDADGDGLTNLQEYLAGTNPTNSDTDGDGVADGQDSYPAQAPTLTLSTTSLYADESSAVSLTVSYMNAPSAVIEQLIDIDEDGVADAGEPVIRSFAVTDGAASTNPNVQGDEDGSSSGAITTTLKFFNVVDRYHAPGRYVFRATVGSFATAEDFTINPVSQSQTIAGTMTDGTNPVPGAFVKLTDKWQRPVAYAVTDNLGQYLINVNSAGDYYVVPEAFGYSATKSLIPLAALSSGQQLTGANLIVSQSGFSVSGQVYDNASGAGIRGVLVTAESAATLSLAMTDAAGNYQMTLPAGEYKVNVEMVDGASPSFKGYVAAPGQALTVNVSSNLIDIDFPLDQAAIQVSGRLLDDAGMPVTSLPIQASEGEATESLAFALTKSDGNFSLGLRQGSDWFISLEDSTAQSQGHIGSVIRNFSTSIGPLSGNDLVAHTVNAWIDGTVKDSANVPLPGVPVIVRDGADSISASVSTANDGTYRLGVFAGNWYVRAATEVLGYLPTAEQNVLASIGQTVTANFVAVNGGSTLFSDDFNRADNATVGNGWTEVETTGAVVDISASRLSFTDTSDKVNRPMVSHGFTQVSSGKIVWEFDFDWTRLSTEVDYRLFMQLGDGALMTTESQDAGVGVNLIWTQIEGNNQRLGYRQGGINTAIILVSGLKRISVEADLDTHTYKVVVGGSTVASGLPFDQNVTLDTVRFFTDGVNDSNFSGRAFDNVLVRRPTTLLSDDFNRTDSATVGNGWTEVETTGAVVDISASRLSFTDTSDKVNRPMVSHGFTQVSSGKIVWEFDFDWTRLTTEVDYRLFMQLGDGALMTTESQDAGVGVNLIWTQIDGNNQRLGYRQGGINTAIKLVSGLKRICVEADLDTHTYKVDVAGTTVASGLPFDQNVNLDTVRFFTDGVNDNNFSGRSFDNVTIRQ